MSETWCGGSAPSVVVAVVVAMVAMAPASAGAGSATVLVYHVLFMWNYKTNRM